MSEAWPVIWLDQIDSTNEEARRRAGEGPFRDQWLAARAQTAGRGRLGRDWVSPRGNLYATALFRWPYDLEEATRLPFAASLAVHDALSKLAPDAKVELKWPNDVRVAGAKICGILIESGETDFGRWIAAGIGINVCQTPQVERQQAVSLADLRGDEVVTAEDVLSALVPTFAARMGQVLMGFETVREDWLARAEGRGARVRVSPGQHTLEGIFVDMAADGGLIIRLPDGRLQTIRTGDVELIKEA